MERFFLQPNIEFETLFFSNPFCYLKPCKPSTPYLFLGCRSFEDPQDMTLRELNEFSNFLALRAHLTTAAVMIYQWQKGDLSVCLSPY